MSAANSNSSAQQFEYAGGEFENDAPYVEEDDHKSADGGDVDDLNSILADLIGSGDYDQSSHADTCFSINAAASFAAISQPEEELAEFELRRLEVESLINVVDVITPIELMQITLVLKLFQTNSVSVGGDEEKRQDEETNSKMAQSVPFLSILPSSASSPSVVGTWFESNQKLLMQGLSLLGLTLNQENVDGDATSANASSPLVYTLLHHGAKVDSIGMIDDILYDLYHLFAIPDVLDLDCLTKQLVQEIGIFVCQQLLNQQKATSASSSSPSSSVDILSRLLSRFSHAADGEVLTSSSSSAPIQMDSASSLFTITLPSATQSQLEEQHPCRLKNSNGELFQLVWTKHFDRCFEAVMQHVANQLNQSTPTSSISLQDFTRSLTRTSPFALLLSPDSESISHTHEFFTNFVAISQHLRQLQANKMGGN